MTGDNMTAVDVPRTARAFALTLSVCLAALLADASRADADGQQATCTGTFPDGWTFAVQTLDARFLHVIWTGPAGQTRVAPLSPYSVNADGFPVFTGMMQDVTEVILVDRSGGSLADGSGIMVYSEQWGWSEGECRMLDTAPEDAASLSDDIQRRILGLRDARATNWLQRNGFSRERIVGSTRSSKTVRWARAQGDRIDVIFYGGVVSDVVLVAV
jgi:hypothetical protein